MKSSSAFAISTTAVSVGSQLLEYGHWDDLQTAMGVTCATFPTSSSACIILFILATGNFVLTSISDAALVLEPSCPPRFAFLDLDEKVASSDSGVYSSTSSRWDLFALAIVGNCSATVGRTEGGSCWEGVAK